MSNLGDQFINGLIYDSLYRWDERYNPVPNLAARPCDVSGDGLRITCALVEATFHDGSPLRADDVVFTYDLLRRACLGPCMDLRADPFVDIRAIDSQTVEFVLAQPEPRVLTVALESVLIESAAVVKAAYTEYRQAVAAPERARLEALARQIDADKSASPPTCDAHLDEAERLLARLPISRPLRWMRTSLDGNFDVCGFGEDLVATLRQVVDTLEPPSGELDAIAQAYPLLQVQDAPVGTGPWRLESSQPGYITLSAFDRYHFGRPAIDRIEVHTDIDWIDGVKAGQLDFSDNRGVTITRDQLEEYEGKPVRFAPYPGQRMHSLQYNLRSGRLFADRNLRLALERCIDKPAIVEAATNSTGRPIYSDVLPSSWAFEPNVPHPARDITEARRLIEEAGWQAGPDGIYAKAGRRLATEIVVRADYEDRVRFVDLVGFQARECGFDLRARPADFDGGVGPMLENFPHNVPGEDQPFDAYFGALSVSSDPADANDFWSSERITSPEQPDGNGSNLVGFSNPEVDELLEGALRTYDQAERARRYRRVQQIIAAEQPFLFAWTSDEWNIVSARVGKTEGSLDLSSDQWAWRREALRLVPASS